MADFSALIQRIKDAVYENGVQAITGQILQDCLKDVVNTVNVAKQDGIYRVTVTVDNNTGVPSATASMDDDTYTLEFSFHNLKGEKGDKGDKGDTPVLTADSDGVIYSDGVMLTRVIKDTTDALTTRADSDHVRAESDHARAETDHTDITRARGDAETAASEANFASLRANTAADNADAAREAIQSDLAQKQDVIPDLQQIRAGATDTVKYTSQSLTDAQKEQARANIGAASDSEVSQLRSEVDELVQKEIDLNDYLEVTTLPAGNGKWVTDSANYPYKSIFIACAPDDRFVVTSGPEIAVWYCFLTTPNYVNNTNVDYATGYSGNGRTTPLGGDIITAPSNATYLCIVVKNMSGTYIGPTSLGVVRKVQSVADASAEDVERNINLRLDGQKATVTTGKYLDSTGAEVAHADYAFTDYIPIAEGDMVNWNAGTTATFPRLVVYDQNKNVLTTFSQQKTSRITTVGAAFIRASYNTTKGITVPIAVNSKIALTIVTNDTAGLEDKVDALDDRIDALDDAVAISKSFSSFIPFRETYENYMTVSDTQGAAIHGDYLFTWVTGNTLNMYDLRSKTRVQQIALPTFPNTRTHANTLSFGAQKYNEADLFPCLYLCSGYTTAAGDPDSQVYVLRLAGDIGALSASLVQTITLRFGTWTEYVVDPVKDVAWINGSGIATYICVAVPTITDGDVTITTSTTIIDQFNVPEIALGLSTKSSGQGRFFYHSRVYFVSGVPFYPGEGEDALYIVVDNTLTHCRESIVALKNFGLTAEPESCFVWDSNFFVVYPSFIAKLIQ